MIIVGNRSCDNWLILWLFQFNCLLTKSEGNDSSPLADEVVQPAMLFVIVLFSFYFFWNGHRIYIIFVPAYERRKRSLTDT